MTRFFGTKTLPLFVAGGLFAALSYATEPPRAPELSTTAQKADSSADAEPEQQKRCPILELAPADAWLIAYTAKGADAFRHPVIEHATGGPQRSSIFARTLAATLDGPTMVTIRGTPTNPVSWRVMLAASTSLDRAGLFDRVRENLVPAWNRTTLAQTIGRLQFVDDKERGYLTLPGPFPVSLTLIVRDTVVLGFSGPESVDDYLEEMNTAVAFVDTEEFQRLNSDRDGPPGTLLYADLRALVPLLAQGLNQTVPNLYHALQLDRVQCAALIGSGPLQPGGSLRLAFGVSEISLGLTRLLASAPSDITLARAFPQDVTYILQGSYKRASDVVDDLMAFAGAIDQEIVDEYLLERADFRRDIGLDPHSEILANLTEGWAFGGRVERDRLAEPLLVLHLGSLEKFKAHLHTLRVMFQLESATSHYRGVAISQAERSLGPLFYAVVDDLLLVTKEELAIHRSIDAILDGTGLDRFEGFRAVRGGVGQRASKFLYFNLADLISGALESGVEMPVPGLEEIAKLGTTVGAAIVPHNRMIALDVFSTDGGSEAFSSTMLASITASLEQARYQSAKLNSASNVKVMLIACKIYANDHKNQWPASLKILVADGSITPKTLSSPYQDRLPQTSGTFYLYRRIEDAAAVKDHSQEVVISEPQIHGGGAVFGFSDGHAEWVASPRADELLAIMRSGH